MRLQLCIAALAFSASAFAQIEAPQESATPGPAESATPAPAEPQALDTIPVPQKQEPVPPAPPEKAGKLEEVIVTAQRREESVQNVPISITVFDQEQLANANITNASDLAAYTPSLSINTRFGAENSTFSIRGFAQDLRTTASVGTYFAEVVAPRGQSNQVSGDGAGPGVFFDLQNVQVLKGPQGTLFGRNATGGAVLIVPQRPTDRFEGYVEFSGGNFTARRGQGVVNVPVTSWLKLRFGVDHNQRKGHLNNVARISADDLGNVDYTAYRLSGVLNITDSLENYTILTYVDSENNGYSSRLYACNTDVVGTPTAIVAGPLCEQQLDRQAASGQNGYYDLYSTVKTAISAIKEKRAINTTTWTISDHFTIKNTVAYAHLHTLNGSSIFGTQFTEPTAVLPVPLPLPPPTNVADPRREYTAGYSILNPNFPVTSQKTWVEELRFQGDLFEQRLNWQAGGYYEHSMPDGWSGNNSASLLFCELATIERPPEGYNCLDPAGGQLGSVRELQYMQTYLNRAVFAQGTYKITDSLSTTLGLRYTWDDTKGNAIRTRHTFIGTVQQPPSPSPSSPAVESHAPTGVIELDYKPVEDVMVYGKVARGYRQGSVNMSADLGIDTFKPESVDAYEIGAKTTFGGWVPGRFNVAAFHNDFTDMQLQTGYVSPTAGPTTAIFNAGKARISGVEVESFLQFFDRLSLSLSYAYLNTKLLEQEDHQDDVQSAGGPLAGQTYTPIADVGDTLPFAAEHAGTASLNWRLPLPQSFGPIEIGATYAYVGKRRTTATSASPFDELEPFALLNLNLSWMAILTLPLDLSMFATNVLNEEYATYSSGTFYATGIESRMNGMPRMVGARLRYNFGAYAN